MRCLLYIVICLFVLASCQKKEPPIPPTASPIFSFIGSIGNDSVNYTAGVDHMFMYTGFFKDTQNLLTVKSYFAKDNCINCEPYLSFEVKDFEASTSPGLAGTLADILKSGVFYSYSIDSILTTTPVENFNFFPSVNSSSSLYTWNFGDGTTSNLSNPTHQFQGGGIKEVRLKVQNFGAVDSLTNSIQTDYQSGCRSQFSVSIDSLLGANVNVLNPSPVFNYAWNFGNGTTGSGANTYVTYASPGIYTIQLTSTTAGCTSTYKQKVNFNSPLANSNFNYTTNITTMQQNLPRVNKSAFVITYKNNGKTYTSFKKIHGLDQTGNIVFTFIGVLPYKVDANGNNTVMITGKVDTYLWNISNFNDSIKIKSDNVLLAAAYPN